MLGKHFESLGSSPGRRNKWGKLQTVRGVFTKLAIIISTQLAIPKYAQLKTETLQIFSQAIKLLEELKSSDLSNLFKNETTKSLDGVIKDLGSDPATQTTARDLKTALNNLNESQP